MREAPRVLTLVGSPDGSALWRVWQPAAELQRQGHTVEWEYNSADGLAAVVALKRIEAIVLARLSWAEHELPQARAFIDTLHRQGIACFAEFDDDSFLAIDEHLTDEADRERLERNKLSLHTIGMVDGITVSTQRLATIVRTLTDVPVVVVPNLIDLAWFRAVQAQAVRVVRGLTIGWAGAKRQDSDLFAVAEAWGRIAANPQYRRVRFVVQGYAPAPLVEAVPAERLHVLPFLSLEEYPLGLVNVDIGCASVANTRFNRSKSIIKCLEYGARSKTAVVATPTLYSQIVRDSDTGYLAETADEWEAALARLIEDAALRRALARRLGREVERSHSLQRFAYRWLDAWGELLREFRERQPQPRKVELWTPGQSTPTTSRLASA